MGSRVPALNEKALMGGDSQLNSLGFETVISVQPDDPWFKRTIFTTINWISTNKKGMTFGILFAAVLMSLFSLLKKRSFNNRFMNTILGVTIGAPLGVCVNCAAPIAQGLYKGGARVETTLAAMISSPTLNFIVLTMLFALFPLYIVAIKIGLTLAFILIAIPVLSHLFARNTEVTQDGEACALPEIGDVDDQSGVRWGPALLWLIRACFKNLWFIVRTTVPLMILAGFLGSLLITILPWDSLAEIIPEGNRIMRLGSMGVVAIIGIFLPVPIAFDVLVSAILLAAGMPVKYVVILLFTLGIFSVYSFSIVWGSIGKKIAIAIPVALVFLGIGAGIIGNRLGQWDLERRKNIFFESFGRNQDLWAEGPTEVRTDWVSEAMPSETLLARLEESALKPAPLAIDLPDELSISRIPFGDRNIEEGPLFHRMTGSEIGIDEPYFFSILKFIEPFNQFRGIATGDVHNDGWVDILVTSDHGVSLYANDGGKGFIRQKMDLLGLNDQYVANAALVDLNDDGWLDIYCSCYREENYTIFNDHGRFSSEAMHELPNGEKTVMTGAAAFGDPDRDGDLDIVFGNWSLGPLTGAKSAPLSSRNVYLRNDDGIYASLPLDGIDGETLTTLFSDFDNDGDLDLIVGNDFDPPDLFYLGDGEGKFETVVRGDGLIPHTTRTTMSATTADIDNDLVPEIYIAQISGLSGSLDVPVSRVGTDLCEELNDPEDRRICREIMTVHKQVQKSRIDPAECLSMEAEEFRRDCVALRLLMSAELRKDLCDLYPESWDLFQEVCRNVNVVQDRASEEEMRRTIPQDPNNNVLLVQSGDGGPFVDKAKEMGVESSGWTWNAKFADVNNDEFQDLFIVNGQFMNDKRGANFFFRNEDGQGFTEMGDEVGLASYFATSSYSYIDYDNDGDLDIIAMPSVGPVMVYENRATRGNSIAFQLADRKGNFFGIGSKITIHYGPGGEKAQLRELQASGGFISYDAPIAYFGLGQFEEIDRLEVTWSTGEKSLIEGPFPAGGRYLIARGGTTATTALARAD